VQLSCSGYGGSSVAAQTRPVHSVCLDTSLLQLAWSPRPFQRNGGGEGSHLVARRPTCRGGGDSVLYIRSSRWHGSIGGTEAAVGLAHGEGVESCREAVC
jgi:hypothetical protein